MKLIPRRRKTWVELVPDQGDSIRLPVEQLPAALSAGSSIDPPQWESLCEAAGYWGLLDRALRLLGRREHFTAELSRKLQRYTFDRDLVQRVLAECQQRGYLDDERAAGIAVQQLVARGGLGRARLRHELQRRGCQAALARQAIAEHAADLDEQAEVERLLAARRRQLVSRALRLRAKQAPDSGKAAATDYEIRRQLGAAILSYLAGRGFSSEIARRAASQLAQELISETKAQRPPEPAPNHEAD